MRQLDDTQKEIIMRTLHHVLLGVAGLFLLTGVGCTSAPTTLGPDYGAAYGLAVHNQILNPEAGTNLQPVSGLDGQGATKVMEKYRKSFEEPTTPPQIVPSIVVSGIKK